MGNKNRKKVNSRGRRAARKAKRTAHWAKVMTKVALRRASQGSKRWQIVSFEGPEGDEATGIVDFLAMRKNHKTTKGLLKKGDLFKIVLIQAKGVKKRGQIYFPRLKKNRSDPIFDCT